MQDPQRIAARHIGQRIQQRARAIGRAVINNNQFTPARRIKRHLPHPPDQFEHRGPFVVYTGMRMVRVGTAVVTTGNSTRGAAAVEGLQPSKAPAVSAKA